MKLSLFDYGFRPNFLAAGVAALLLVPLWALSFSFGIPLGTRWPPTLWHGHEMVFGFVAAAIAGFLLTAVPSWTGRRGFAGLPLAGLAALWLAARLAVYVPAVSAPVLAALDVAFLPGLALLIAPALLRAANRNSPVLIVLAALAACNGAFHWAAAHGNAPQAEAWLKTAINVLLVLATVIGGRILPAFTNSALAARGLGAGHPGSRALDLATTGAMVAIVVVDIPWPATRAAGVMAILAALAHAARLARWRTPKTWRDPIVWVLHVGYVWIPVGLALKGVAILRGSAFSAFWLHALTVGALSTLILAVMTRASLGHTGRALRAGPATVAAYCLLTGAACLRVFGLAVVGGGYPAIVLAAALLWTSAFALFVTSYGPMLARPRVDGRKG
jgi:uncharacterized protein involved in response to NO